MIESHFFEIPRAAGLSGAVQSGNVYSSPEKLNEIPIRVGSKEYTMIGWGEDNQLPYQIKELIDKNGVMSQNKFFNTLTCYGRGLEYMDASTVGSGKPVPTRDKDICLWQLRNSLKRFFAEQIVDLKYYFFSVAVIILNRDRNRIVKIVHKDACHVRFEKADKQTGRILHVFYADWRDNDNPDYIEDIPLLDEQDPFGDLMARTGHRDYMDSDFKSDTTRSCKYAVVCKMPTPGCQYYPIPPSTVITLRSIRSSGIIVPVQEGYLSVLTSSSP